MLWATHPSQAPTPQKCPICLYIYVHMCLDTRCREQASQICCAARLLFDSERMLGLLRCKSTMQPDFIFPKQFLLQSRMEAALFHPKFSRLEGKKKSSLLSRAFSSFPTCIKEHSNPPPRTASNQRQSHETALSFGDRQHSSCFTREGEY